MKKYEFNLSASILKKFFPYERVKTKAQIIEILMEASRYMLINPIVEEEKIVGKLVLYIDKMSRLFFFNDDKFFSISFPFYAFFDDDKYSFSFQNDIKVTSELISKVITIIKCDEFKEKCSIDFVSPICDYEEECNENFWVFLRELLLMEDGYIRYDHDSVNHQRALERGEEHQHPLHHYDLFYSSKASFKIGLQSMLGRDDFFDFLNTNSDCKYIQ